MTDKQKISQVFSGGGIAGTNEEEKEVNETIKSNTIEDIKNKVDSVTQQTRKEDTHKFRGYYLEHEVADYIDELLGVNPPKGKKSTFVNRLLREKLEDEYGLNNNNK